MANRAWTVNERVAVKAAPHAQGYVLQVVPTSATQEAVPLYKVHFDQSKYVDQDYLSEQLIAEAEALKLEAEAKAKEEKK